MTANLGTQLPKRADFVNSADASKTQVAASKEEAGGFNNVLEETQQEKREESSAVTDARRSNSGAADSRATSLDVSASNEVFADALTLDERERESANGKSGTDLNSEPEVSNGPRSSAPSLTQQIQDLAGSIDNSSKVRSHIDGPGAQSLMSDASDQPASLVKPANQQSVEMPVLGRVSSDAAATIQGRPVQAEQVLRPGTGNKNSPVSSQASVPGAKEIVELLPNGRTAPGASGGPVEQSDRLPSSAPASSLSTLSRMTTSESREILQPFADAAGKVVVVSKETHLPTVNGTHVTQQIAQRVDQGLKEIASTDTDMTPTFRAADPQASGSVVRKITIQLNPRELGIVTVQMSLRQNALQLDLQAVDHAVARSLGQNRDALSSMLQGSGYVVDDIVVRPADAGRMTESTMSQDRSNSDDGFSDRGTRDDRNREEGAGFSRQDDRHTQPRTVGGIHNGGEGPNEDVSDRDIYL